MMAVTEAVTRAIINLEGSQDFQTLLKWLQDSYSNQLDVNTHIVDLTKLRWGQGMAQNLAEILAVITNARPLYHTIRK